MRSHPLALASKLLGSSVLAQVAVLAATAFAARRLHPHDFAVYGAVAGLAAVLAAINTLAAESRSAVVDQERSDALMRAGATAVVVTTVAAAAIGFPVLLAGHDWGTVLVLGAGVGGLTGAQQLVTAIVLRTQRQSLLARGRLLQGFSNALLIVALLFLPIAGYLTLCLAWIASLVLGVGIVALGCRGEVAWGVPRRADWSVLRHEVGRQPVANLLAGAVQSMPLLVLPATGQTVQAGAWALVNRFISPVVNTAFSTLQPLYYGRSAQLLRDGHLSAARDFHARWLRWLALAGVPVTLGFFGLAWVGLPLLGDQWRVGWLPAAAGALYFGTLFVCLPLSQTLQLLHHVRLAVRWTIVRFVVCALPFALMPVVGASTALLAWSVASAVTFCWQLSLHRRCFRDTLAAAPTAAATPEAAFAPSDRQEPQ